MYITVLEDDLALQRAVISALTMAEHKVVGFENSSLLIENMDTKTELYLLDINVEGINGLDLLELLKRENPNVKVIMMSVSTDLSTIDKAYTLGSIDYIKKPFHLKELLHKVALLEKHKVDFFETLPLKEGEELTKSEKNFLKLLYETNPYVLTYDEIANKLYEEELNINALRSSVRRIRSKLAVDILKTIPKEGYCLKNK